MNAEQGVLTLLGELRALVSSTEERCKDLQSKLDSLELEYKIYKEKYPIDESSKLIEFSKLEKK